MGVGSLRPLTLRKGERLEAAETPKPPTIEVVDRYFAILGELYDRCGNDIAPDASLIATGLVQAEATSELAAKLERLHVRVKSF